MNIQAMTLKSVDIEAPDGQEVYILVDGETAIRVKNFGTAEYRWRVDADARADAAYDPGATMASVFGDMELDGYWTAAKTFGVAAAWWEERTFAHAVMDILNNH